jgi:hypothetical protein
MADTVPIPRALVWDYAEAPDELLWRLQGSRTGSPPSGEIGGPSSSFTGTVTS